MELERAKELAPIMVLREPVPRDGETAHKFAARLERYRELRWKDIPLAEVLEGPIKGPCRGCGIEDYVLSTSGPEWCGACACGVPVGDTRLRKRNNELSSKLLDAYSALEIALGTHWPLNEHMRARGQAVIDKTLKEAKAKGLAPAPPPAPTGGGRDGD
jgi:hypothetical protein